MLCPPSRGDAGKLCQGPLSCCQVDYRQSTSELGAVQLKQKLFQGVLFGCHRSKLEYCGIPHNFPRMVAFNLVCGVPQGSILLSPLMLNLPIPSFLVASELNWLPCLLFPFSQEVPRVCRSQAEAQLNSTFIHLSNRRNPSIHVHV